MKLQGSDLSTEMRGADVALLHKELGQLGFTISAAETQATVFGADTAQAVIQFQQTHQLPTSGVVDAQTAALINQEIDKLQPSPSPRLPVTPQPFTVRGQVRWADGRPLVGAEVQAVDRDVRGEEQLGKTRTGSDGRYEIRYASNRFSRAEKNSADLVVRVTNTAGTVVANSPVLFNAPAEAIVDHVVSQTAAGMVSEYDRLTTELQPLLVNVSPTGSREPTLIDRLANLKDDEIDFLTNETGIERQKLVFLTTAAVLEKQAVQHSFHIPAAVFYGLAREGVSINLAALGLLSQQKCSDALEKALNDNLIPAALRHSLPTLLAQLRQLAVQETLQTPPAVGRPALSQLLGTVLTAPSQQAAFLTAYANHGDQPIEDFWQNLRAQPQFAQHVDSLQLALQLGVLTQNHLPLIQELRKTFKVKSPRDLVKFEAATWTNLVNEHTIGLPPDIPGNTPEEQTANYVNGILSLLHAAFPTDTIAQVVATTPNVNLDDPTRQAVSQFFRNAPDFDVRSMRVDAYIADHAATVFNGIAAADQAKVTNHVKRLQRLFQVSASAETLTALLGTDLDSAHAIAQVPRTSFVAQYQAKLGGEQQALALYQRAVAVHARSLHTYVLLNDALTGVSPRAVSGNGGANGNTQHAIHPLVLPLGAAGGNGQSTEDVVAKHLPNYAELFGGLDMCDCQHCRSVLSPAAYFVDLLEFLRHSTPNAASNTPLDILLGRRPDLEHLQLTCENTNTTLPYVDLVNEVLEGYVALGHPDASAAHNTGDATAQELDANPQYTISEAYKVLDQAVYPFTLPFNQPVAVARVYFEHLGSSRYEVLNAFRKDNADSTIHAINVEYLKIATEESQVLIGKNTDGTDAPVRQFYGYDTDNVVRNNTQKLWKDWLADVLEFLPRTGIAYTDLVELLKTRFINPAYPQGEALDLFQRIPFSFATLTALVQNHFANPDPKILVALEQAKIKLQELIDWSHVNFPKVAEVIVLDAPDSKCDLEGTRLQYLDGRLLDDPALSKLHRFIRLWRKLGWSLTDLDRALVALQTADITSGVLNQLSQIKQLQDDLNAANLQVLLSLWAPIDTHGDDSLYKKLFLSKAAQRIDPDFQPNQDGSVLTAAQGLKISDHVPTILATLRVSEADLSTIRIDAGLVDDLTANPPQFAPLTLPTVSALYRYAALAHTLRLRINDLVALKTLSGINPFATPDQTIQFVTVVRKVQQSGFAVAQLNYLYRHLMAPPVNLAPQPTAVLLLAKTLRDGLTKIVQDNVLVPDSTGDVTRTKLSLLFDSAVVDQTIAMINGSALYTAPLDVLPANIVFPDTLKNKISYDPSVKLLRFKGAMTTAEQSALLAVATDNAYQAAISNLFRQPGTYIQNTLSGFLADVADAEKNLLRDLPSLDQDLNPVLLDQHGSPTTDPAQMTATAIANKFAYVLTRLLPYVRDQLSHAFVKQTLVDAFKLDGALAQLLLESVLQSTADPTQPAMADLLALTTAGLTGSYFPSTALSGVPTVRTDAAIAFDGNATAPETTVPSGTGSARWSGMLLAPNNGDFTFSVRAGGSVQLWVGDSGQPLALQPDPSTNELVSAPIGLKANQLYNLRLEVTQLPSQNPAVELRWQSATTPKAIIPADNLYPRALLDTLTRTLTRLHKAALIITIFNLTAAEVAYISNSVHKDDFDGFDLNALPLARDAATATQIDQQAVARFTWWRRVSDLVTLRNSLPRGEVNLIDVFAANSLDDAKNKLTQATGWDAPVIEALVGAGGFTLSAADFKKEIALLRLQNAMRLIKRLGVLAEQLFAWAKLDADFVQLSEIAQDLKKTVHAKYDEETWLTIAKPLNDTLRERQRDALVAYLLPRLGMTDSNQLFEYFLIDVDMSACMETSRIKQAISSVQLFVQRCLINLEQRDDQPALNVSPSAIDAEQWEWMKHYRVWEANRKVFLYPENWIEPELRDNKSPFFKELESELLQNNLTTSAAETAFLNYLEKLEQVARLEIRAMYWQNKDPETLENVNILHVFGRTFNTPLVYFYRRLLNNTTWTAWEKIQLDIESEHLIPVIWNRRLYLFWPQFTKQVEATGGPPSITIKHDEDSNVPTSPPRQYYDIKLAWSEYKDGKWSPKQISSDSLTASNPPHLADKLPDLAKYAFKATITEDGSLSIRLFADSDIAAPELAPSWPVGLMIGEFLFPRCGRPYANRLPNLPDNLIPAENSVPDFMGAAAKLSYAPLTMITGDYGDQPLPAIPPKTPDHDDLPTLEQTPGIYHLMYPHQFAQFVLQAPFSYEDERKTYVITPYFAADGIKQVQNGNRVSIRGGELQSVTTATADNTTWANKDATVRYNWVSQVVVNRYSLHLKFSTHYHPYVCDFIKALRRGGLGELLTVDNQRLNDDVKSIVIDAKGVPQPVFLSAFLQDYRPTSRVDPNYPREEVDFGFNGSYSLYNWELFFHAPMFIATRLSKNQRFSEAMKWFHYIFNPTTDTPNESAPARYWRVLPFKTTEQERIDELLTLLATNDSMLDAQQREKKQQLIKQWNELKDHPFQPHLIARSRLSAYQKNIFMKHLDNLIAWGDHLYRQGTIEAINEATQYYVLAADLLGPRPQRLPARGKVAPETYTDLKGKLDAFSNALVLLENEFPFSGSVSSDPKSESGGLLGVGPTLYFCVPQNDKLLGYWDTVADRLFKIRHCMNIEGVVRQLPLFEPPIDPALLVQAAAQGVDLSSVLSDLNAPLPYYRFSYVLQKALEMCAEVKALGGALLSALEKKDAEDLALLRATHETNILKMMEDVKQKAQEEASDQIEVLNKSRLNATGKYTYYQTLLGSSANVPEPGTNIPQPPVQPEFAQDAEGGLPLLQPEQHELDRMVEANNVQISAGAAESLANVFHILPDLYVQAAPWGVGMKTEVFGGDKLGAASSAVARGLTTISSHLSMEASKASRMGSHFRAQHERLQQSNIAAGEIMQIDQQITAANVRYQIATQDLNVHRQQMQDAKDIEDFLSFKKYTTQELYAWMRDELSATYFQCYQMAYDLAKKAERAFRFERGMTESNFIQFGYWDSLQKGLLAGERLYLALKQMERAYLEQNKREYEITKHISLVLYDPLALIRLKETGQCEIELPEALFDADYPGHYMRRIKSVSLTIPCVVGPYTSINCTLTLLRNKTRINSVVGSQYSEDVDNGDDRFVTNFAAMQSIATSHAQNDNGMFELNFHDERYLPFEGAGAVSRWRLELNAVFRQFDYETISDVILQLRYTAREGGERLKQAAIKALTSALQDDAGLPLMEPGKGYH